MEQSVLSHKTAISKFDGEYAFLSNFYESPIRFQGYTYSTVEHYYQAQKATNHQDRIIIAMCKTPGQAKRMGRRIDITHNWEDIKFSIMLTGVVLKFKQNPELRTKLIETYPIHLIEGNNWHDNYWGMCVCSNCRNNTVSLNTFGQILEMVRRNCMDKFLKGELIV